MGDRSYVLAGIRNTSGYECLSSCVYRLEEDDGKVFCFAAGDLEVECLDGGEVTEEPVGESEFV